MFRINLELPAQILDEDAEIVHLITVIGPPYCLQEFSVWHGFIRMLGQIAEKIKLFWGQMLRPKNRWPRSERQSPRPVALREI